MYDDTTLEVTDASVHRLPRAAHVPAPKAEPSDPPLQSDDAAHREFVARQRKTVRRFVLSLVGEGAAADADDVTQQTLQQALQKLDSFRGGNLRAWLFCIARHVLSNCRRETARLEFMEFDEQQVHALERVLQTAPDSVQAAYDARASIRRCMACIATRLRLVEEVAVLLSDVHGFSDKEAAARLQMNLPSYKFLLHKARAHLHATAAAADDGLSCPLVSKTGVRRSCPGGARRDRARPGSRRQLCGLDDAALQALSCELVVALAVG